MIQVCKKRSKVGEIIVSCVWGGGLGGDSIYCGDNRHEPVFTATFKVLFRDDKSGSLDIVSYLY
jgi:hypothetical protein